MSVVTGQVKKRYRGLPGKLTHFRDISGIIPPLIYRSFADKREILKSRMMEDAPEPVLSDKTHPYMLVWRKKLGTTSMNLTRSL